MLFGLCPPSLQRGPACSEDLGGAWEAEAEGAVSCCRPAWPACWGELGLTSSIYHHGDKQVREKQGGTSHHLPCGG